MSIGPLENMADLTVVRKSYQRVQEGRGPMSLLEQYEAAVAADERTSLINLKEDLKSKVEKVKSNWWQGCKMLFLSCFKPSATEL